MRGRLALLPGLRRLWRDEHTLQLGTDTNNAVVLEVTHPALARVLDLLDGNRTERGVQVDARCLGVPEATVVDLIATLRASGLLLTTDELMPASMPERARRYLWTEAAALALDGGPHGRANSMPGHLGRTVKPAEALRRRAAAAALVSGPARLAAPLAAVLAASGVGHVDTAIVGRAEATDAAVGGVQHGDHGRPLRNAAADAVLRAAPDTDITSLREGQASFVVQIGQNAPSEVLAYGYARRAMPHLLIEERDNAILVGPLVASSGSPCLNCLDLHRRDRDPAWPAMIAQLTTGHDGPVPIAMATTMTCVGVAAGQVLAYLDGAPVATIGASFEISFNSPPRRRSWVPHPRCDCRARRPRRHTSDRVDAGSHTPQTGAVEWPGDRHSASGR